MIRLGMIGLNEGNGHPFSYSALFNGYDPTELEARCPFSLIKDYLPREHRNEVFIEGAKVTHIWTQSRTLSEDVARVALIPNIVDRCEDLLGNVDAVILARDDPWNHLSMAEPFLKRGIPIFIDKQLTSTRHDLEALLALAGPDYPLMAGSPMRFTRDLANARATECWQEVKTIHGMSRVSWMRYGHHLFEGIAAIWGTDILWVRSLQKKIGHDIVQIKYRSGLNVILEFIEDIQLPIQFTCYSTTQPAFMIPFQDFFHSFREMLKGFVSMIETGNKVVAYDEIISIARVILAGDISKQLNGVCISPRTLESTPEDADLAH